MFAIYDQILPKLIVLLYFALLYYTLDVTFFVMVVMVMRTPYEVPAPEATIVARHLCTWEQRRQCTSCPFGWSVHKKALSCIMMWSRLVKLL